MFKVPIELINEIKDLIHLSKSHLKGEIRVNVSSTAKKLNLSRNTVSRYLNGYVPKGTRERKKYLDDYKKEILKVLKDKYQVFDYITHLHKYFVREYNITCSLSTFHNYIKNDHEINKAFDYKKSSSFTERFETPPGYQIQFDLKERVPLIDINGIETRIYIPTLTLGWSRFNCRKLTLDNKTETLLCFLAESFEELGGVPKEIVIDNLKAFVIKPRTKDAPAILVAAFEQFCKDYNIQVNPCVSYRPQTKGKTETQNKTVDQLKNYSGKYTGLLDMHDKLRIINEEDNDSISQATKLPRRFLLKKEKDDFSPLPTKEIREKYHLSLSKVHVSNDCLFSYKSNKYSLPKEFLGLNVDLKVIKNELHVYYNNKIIDVHKISSSYLNIKDEHNLKYKINTEDKSKNEIILNEMRNVNYD